MNAIKPFNSPVKVPLGFSRFIKGLTIKFLYTYIVLLTQASLAVSDPSSYRLSTSHDLILLPLSNTSSISYPYSTPIKAITFIMGGASDRSVYGGYVYNGKSISSSLTYLLPRRCISVCSLHAIHQHCRRLDFYR